MITFPLLLILLRAAFFLLFATLARSVEDDDVHTDEESEEGVQVFNEIL